MTEYPLTCGIEIHQQLDTKKLFCSCDSHLSEEGHGSCYRRLRPTTSEMGEIDRAALAQFQRNLGYRYQSAPGVSCLVELDEEPPHDTNSEALATTLTFSEMMKARVVDEIHFMRKIVVDGSNTSGFQRTALISMNGSLEVNGRDISILSICLEEDACRKVETTDAEITYRMDRLGIPLIEIATGPDMHDPEEVMEVALRIGTLLRATRKVKRGIGTIREDLNISVPGGARIEIKGVQELRLLPLYVQNEMNRQNMLIRIKGILLERGVKPVAFETVDVTDVFKSCEAKVIKGALADKGRVIAVRLPGFKGVMNGDSGRLRLGAEMAQRARTKGVKGIFHSDELPAYGIEPSFVDELRDFLGMNGEFDAFAICAAREKKAIDALSMAVDRANEALVGVPEETRDPLPDGTSKYSRPLPGAARMYPETDVPPINISKERMEEVRSSLPELPEEIQERIVKQYGINAQQARQMVRDDRVDLFEKLCQIKGMASIAATTLLNTYGELETAGVDVHAFTEARLMDAFAMLSEEKFAKEALPAILKEMGVSGCSASDAVKRLGLESVDESEAIAIISKIVNDRADFVKEKGMGAIGGLMGPVMGALRGKLDGKRANEILMAEIKKIL